MTIGDRIKQRREELNLSQEELAHKLGLRGRSSVSKVEKTGDRMTSTLIKAYADALECTPAYLMGFEDTSYETKFSFENASLIGKIRNDKELTDALKVYFSLSEDKKKYAVNLIKMLGD